MGSDNTFDNLKRWWTDLKTDLKGKASGLASKADTIPGGPAAESAAALPLGPFEASDATLGEGGYAKVVLGRNRSTGEKVAIKLLDTRQDSASGRAASSEAAIVRELEHNPDACVYYEEAAFRHHTASNLTPFLRTPRERLTIGCIVSVYPRADLYSSTASAQPRKLP